MIANALVQAALQARMAAYAPYSSFKVGAALRLRGGGVVTGVNVENASYGLTLCAERNAVAHGVQQGLQPGDIAEVAVVADSAGLCSPCGACRQVLAEFAPPATVVWLHNLRDGQTLKTTVAELLPLAFGAAHLQE